MCAGRTIPLTILNHVFCQYNCYCDSLARFVSDANYGLLCTNDNCISPHRTIVRFKDYHLDNLFSDCSVADEINVVRYANVIMNINPRTSQKDLLIESYAHKERHTLHITHFLDANSLSLIDILS